MITNYKVGDIVILRKSHPCNKKSTKFLIIETGAICKIKCINCQHDMLSDRDKLNKSIVKIEK